MEIDMKESIKLRISTEKEPIILLQEEVMRDNGKLIKCMDMEPLISLMEINIKENL